MSVSSSFTTRALHLRPGMRLASGWTVDMVVSRPGGETVRLSLSRGDCEGVGHDLDRYALVDVEQLPSPMPV